MKAPGAWSVVRSLLRIGRPRWRTFAQAGALGAAGAAATIGLLAGSGYVVDRAALRPGLGAIAGVLASVEVLAFLRGPLRYGERLSAHRAAFSSLTRWRVWLYDRIEPLAPAGLSSWRTGDLLARMTEDVDTVVDLLVACLLPLVVTATAAALGVALVTVLLPWAGAVLAASLLVAILASPIVEARAGTARGSEAALRGDLSAQVVDLLRGAPELLAFGRVDAAFSRLEETEHQLAAARRRRAWAAGASGAIVVACVGASVVGVLAFGVAAVHAHRMSAVALGVLPLAAVGTFETVPSLGRAARRAMDVVASGRRLLALAQVPHPVVDPAHPDPAPRGHPDVSVTAARLRYGDDLPWALDGVDLKVRPGELVGLMGSSGAGKSSLLHALLRFWPLHDGTITLDGLDVARLEQGAVRRTLALVDEDAHLFAGTIRDNVALGRPRSSEEAVHQAIERAQLGEWLETLPRGVDTEVGEGGARVSGGQRRRLAVARALLCEAPVLLLDEPTAGLDETSGTLLVTEVVRDARARGASVLVVSHASSDMAPLDRVVRMEDGRTAPS